ncbi:dihydroneopterin triphosphate diphosphatase [Snodgrassella sp. CFCC 13594]|uniref:dihydroneopterin triphosphate diphosphatase n=1 Tax=Snodgrassella sp. CFCC 13594 TaxID=1775559 RepID=UPI00082F1CC5|nr:dihydroneopterin triphosphate diphosphatase [Snodgrassella sp. CFCC 13594]
MTKLDPARTQAYKQPQSVLVVIYNPLGQILLLERADKPGFWQSVTGSFETGEQPIQTARREVHEETSIRLAPHALQNWHASCCYEIYAHWRHRYAPGVTHNTEHFFSACIPADSQISLSTREHLRWGWYDRQEAAEKVFSPSNADAIRQLPQHWHIPAKFSAA